MNKTSIEWTDLSWNPIRSRNLETGKLGWHCEHAGIDCELCYSETTNEFRGTGLAFTRQNRNRVDIFLDEQRLQSRMPTRPSKIFVRDMTDLFGDFVRDEWLDRIFTVMMRSRQHTFQILTKRPQRMHQYISQHPEYRIEWPHHIWLGTSVGLTRYLDRLDILRRVPAPIRFVSFEPLLEDLGTVDLTGIHWVIAGAESDARRRARPMQLDWVRDIRNQCIAAGVPFFFKQDAERGKKLPTPELDGRQWREFPDDPERAGRRGAAAHIAAAALRP